MSDNNYKLEECPICGTRTNVLKTWNHPRTNKDWIGCTWCYESLMKAVNNDET